jgi:hypothetical protein
MKYLLLCLIAIVMLRCGSSGYGQTFDTRDYNGRDDFFKHMQMSKGFQTKDKLKCKNLNSKFVIWKYEDTVHFDLHALHAFSHDNRTDSIRLDTVFSKPDRSYIMSQFNYYRDHGMIWVDCGTWRIIKSNPNRKVAIPYWEFSQPLYSEDYTKCLVKMNYWYKESDYVISTVLFYKNKRGKWIEKAVIDLVSPGGK